MNCGLLGRKLGHSYSPQIHARLGGYSYTLFEKEPENLESFLLGDDFDGINVTIPYKKEVIPYLNALTPIAERLGAVNTIVRRDGKLIGHNTDYFGFRSMVEKSGLNLGGKKVLVLGTGGASNTAVSVLKELGANAVTISRTGNDNYANLERHRDAAVIINCTPVGMYPDVGRSPVNLDLFPHLEGVLDVIYNPARTQLLMDAEELGLPAINGLWMLVAQAKESAEWFMGKAFDHRTIAAIQQELRLQMENIVLIGMPGCGKTTIGKLLANATGKQFVDADEKIVELAGKSIPRIFDEDGERVFREWETKALEELGKRSGLVIATGGGCVTQERNYPLLHQNGTLFWLQRDIGKLPTQGRPLSQANPLDDMYHIRKPMYERFADHIIDNNGSPEETLAQVLEVWK